jgi:hypothetical protein
MYNSPDNVPVGVSKEILDTLVAPKLVLTSIAKMLPNSIKQSATANTMLLFDFFISKTPFRFFTMKKL